MFAHEKALHCGTYVPGMINVCPCVAECLVMGLEFDVDSERLGEVGIMKGVGGAVVRLEKSP